MNYSEMKMNSSGEEFEINEDLLKKVANINQIDHMDNELVSDIFEGQDQKDVDSFLRKSSKTNFKLLRSYARKLATSFIDAFEFKDCGLSKEAEEEEKNQKELGEKMRNILNGIPDEDVRSAVALSVRSVSDAHGRNLNANEKVKKKAAKWWNKLLIAIGVLALTVGSFLVFGGHITIGISVSLPIGLLCVMAVALGIYLILKKERVQRIPLREESRSFDISFPG